MLHAIRSVTPIGELVLCADSTALRRLLLPQDRLDAAVQWEPTPLLMQAEEELQAYFAGTLRVFRVPAEPEGTAFAERVWQTLRTVPYGTVWSYARLAAAIGQPKAVRAVGGALHRNPIPLWLPCHRIVSSDGSLGGFRSGTETKRFLLQLEKR